MGNEKNKQNRLAAPRRQAARAARSNAAQPGAPVARNMTGTRKSNRSNQNKAENVAVTEGLDATQGNGAPPPVVENEGTRTRNNEEQVQGPDLNDEEQQDYELYGQQQDNEFEDYNDLNYKQGSDEEIEDILADEGDEETYEEDNSRDIEVLSEPSYEVARASKPKKAPKANTKSKNAAISTRGKKAAPAITIPDKIKIRLMVDVGGSTTMAMVTSDDSFDEVADTVAGVLEKDLDDVNLRYKPSWATKNSPVTNLTSDTDWDFLLERIRDYVVRSLGKKANAGNVPSWTITIYDGGEQQTGKRAGRGQVQDDNKPKGNIYWMTQLRNKYKCTNNEHKFPCYVLNTCLYEPDVPYGHHCRITPGAITGWARKIDSHEAGTTTMPNEILMEILKNEGYKGGHQQETDLITRPSKKSRKQRLSGFPQFFPFMLPSLESFSPFKSRNSSAGDSDTTPPKTQKRNADEANLDDMPGLDRPKLADWLPLLDEKNPDFPVTLRDLIPRTRGEGIVYLADLLEFSGAELGETIDVQLGTAKFLLRKARVEMEKLGAKRARSE